MIRISLVEYSVILDRTKKELEMFASVWLEKENPSRCVRVHVLVMLPNEISLRATQ